MEKYTNIKSEHQLRSLVFDDYFKNKDISWEQEIEKIDFIITGKQSRKGKGGNNAGGGSGKHYLWAETKKSETEQYIMLTQLLLTIQKPYDKNEYIIPNYVGCFDTVKIIFVPTNLILNILHDNDIKWNITPSDIKDEYFLKIISKLKYVLFNHKDVKIFTFGTHDEEIKNFIKNNILKGDIENKFEITEDNFDRVYLKWLEKVKPSISVNWEEEKKIGLYDADFYLADLLSKDDTSIKDKLLIVLQNDHYKLIKALKKSKFFAEDDEYVFKDKQKAYKVFWSIYQRPPLPEYWDKIIYRKDLLVPQDIRERKGSFFTPQIWVEKSQEYIASVFGKNWQDNYYVWDCCAGTGNLLVGINRNIENVFASTIDGSDVKAMYDRIENGARLLKKNVFQFDFLNDDFKKLPKALKDIIDDDKKRKKLIIYINPPYAEGGNSKQMQGTAEYKKNVMISKTHNKYKHILGNASREIYQQFLIRIRYELDNCKIANFSKLKIIQGSSTEELRKYFNIKLKKLFIVPAETFDNVKGQFPIGFFIWDTEIKDKFKSIKADVYDVYDKDVKYIGKKNIINYSNVDYISKWVNSFKNDSGFYLGWMHKCTHNDVQNANMLCIVNKKEQMNIPRGIEIYDNNLLLCGIRFAISKVITRTWLNDRDQFLFPNDGWKKDTEFQNDCFAFTIFNTNIQSKYGTNHWIPFTEKEVGITGEFESHFMSDFIAGKIKIKKDNDLFADDEIKRKGKMVFSIEAKDVYNAGLKLWKYYLKEKRVNINASFYDIREYFQGVSNGRMNNKSDDEEYNILIGNLREGMKTLAKKIEPKVYEYGFLL